MNADERRATLRAKIVEAAGDGVRDAVKAGHAKKLAGLFFDEIMETVEYLARIADALEGIERQLGGIPGRLR